MQDGFLDAELGESLGREHLFYGELAGRQALLVMVTRECLDDVAVLFDAIGPPFPAHRSNSVLHCGDLPWPNRLTFWAI